MKKEEIIFSENVIYEVSAKTKYEKLPITEGVFKVVIREVHSGYVVIKAIRIEDYNEKYGYNRIENTIFHLNEIDINNYYNTGYIKLLTPSLNN